MIIQQNSRIAHHRLTTQGANFTIPTSTDFTDGTWLSTDLLIGEIGMNISDDTIFFRTTNGIVEVATASGLSSLWNRSGDDIIAVEDALSTPVVYPNILPPTDDVSNIGDPSNNWMHLYLSKDVHCSNVRIANGNYQTTQTTEPTIVTTTQNGVTSSGILNDSTDARGTITTNGTQNQAAYTRLTITFQHGFTSANPTVVVMCTSDPSTVLQMYTIATSGGFDFFFLATGAPNADLQFSWICIG